MGLLWMGALIPGVLRLGSMRVSVYGFFAAVGLLGALWLSQRTGPWAGVEAGRIWDAGVVAVVAALVASRVLLVAGDPAAFLRYPLIVLSLPSMSWVGTGLAGAVVLGYLRWQGLGVLGVLDAWSPCAGLLGAVLALGHFVEGTDAGMPTRLPWGVVSPGDTVLGRTHPVQLYAMVCALGLTGFGLWRLRRERVRGVVAGWSLVLGGVGAFLLDMVAQPTETFGASWLEGGQYVALGAAVVGGCLLTWAGAGVEVKTKETV